MARGVNKVILLGNLGANPETRVIPQGGVVSTVRLATSEQWKDRNTGQAQERTEWHRVVFFNRLGEICDQYLSKGSKIYVEGSIRTRKWQGQDGQDRYSTEIVAKELQMLDGNPNAGQPSAQGSNYQPRNPAGNQAGGQQQGSTYQARNPASTPMGGNENFPPDDFDDDIPF